MSDEQGRARVPGWAWGAVGVFLVLFAVNLSVTAFAERLPAVLNAEVMQTIAFWGGWSTAAGACVGGWWWTGEALARSDRDGTRRLRACFVMALCGVVLLAIATFEPALEREHLASVSAALAAFILVPFALAARALVDRGHRRRRRRSREDS